jgi:hypothetical protein
LEFRTGEEAITYNDHHDGTVDHDDSTTDDHDNDCTCHHYDYECPGADDCDGTNHLDYTE